MTAETRPKLDRNTLRLEVTRELQGKHQDWRDRYTEERHRQVQARIMRDLKPGLKPVPVVRGGEGRTDEEVMGAAEAITTILLILTGVLFVAKWMGWIGGAA